MNRYTIINSICLTIWLGILIAASIKLVDVSKELYDYYTKPFTLRVEGPQRVDGIKIWNEKTAP